MALIVLVILNGLVLVKREHSDSILNKVLKNSNIKIIAPECVIIGKVKSTIVKGYPVDTLKYDEGPYEINPYTNTFWGVRFSVPEACSVLWGIIGFYQGELANSYTHCMFIRKDFCGAPADTLDTVQFSNNTAYNGGGVEYWIQSNKKPVVYKNFWLTFRCDLRNYAGALRDVLLIQDTVLNHCRSFFSDDDIDWHDYSEGDLYIRAVVHCVGHPPNKPSLLSPFNNIRVYYDTVRLKFTAIDSEGNQIRYRIYWDTLSDFSTADSITLTTLYNSGSVVSYVFPSGVLLDKHTYYWKVRGQDPSGTGLWGECSEIWAFSIDTSLTEEDFFETKKGQFLKTNILTAGLEVKGDSVILGLSSGDTVYGPENFEDQWIAGPPEDLIAPYGWTQKRGANHTSSKYWNRSDLQSDPTPFGDWAALHPWDYGNSIFNSWLISPTLNLRGCANCVLKFALHQSGNWHDSLLTKVSGDSGVTWSTVKIYDNWIEPDHLWETMSIDISNWDNWNKVNIAFVYKYADQDSEEVCGIDNVFIFANVNWGELITTEIPFSIHPKTPISWDKIIISSNTGDSIGIKLQYKEAGEWKDATPFCYVNTLDIYHFDPEIYDTIRIFLRFDHNADGTEPVLKDLTLKWDPNLRCIIDSLKENYDYLVFRNDTLYYGAIGPAVFTLYITSIGSDSVVGEEFFADRPKDTIKPFSLQYSIEQGVKKWGWLTVTSYTHLNGGQTARDSIYIMCDTLPPTGVKLSTPASNDSDIAIQPILFVSKAEDPLGVEAYQIQLDTTKDFNSVNLITSPWFTDTMWVCTTKLKSDMKYYWRVRAKDKGGNISIWCGRSADVAGCDSFKTAKLSVYIDSIKWAKHTYARVYSAYPWLKIYYRTDNTPNIPNATQCTIFVSSDSTLDSVVGSTAFGDTPKDKNGAPYFLVYKIDQGDPAETEITITAYRKDLKGKRKIELVLDNANPTNLFTIYPHYSLLNKVPRNPTIIFSYGSDNSPGPIYHGVQLDSGNAIITSSPEYQKWGWDEDTTWSPTPPLLGKTKYKYRVWYKDCVGNRTSIIDSFYTKGEPYFWEGDISNNWHTPGNWDSDETPMSTPPYSKVFIQEDATRKKCSSLSDVSYSNNLVIDQPCTLWINNNSGGFIFAGTSIKNDGLIRTYGVANDSFLVESEICTLKGSGMWYGKFVFESEKVIIPAGCTLRIESGDNICFYFRETKEFINKGVIIAEDSMDTYPELVFCKSAVLKGGGIYKNVGIKTLPPNCDTLKLMQDLTHVGFIKIGSGCYFNLNGYDVETKGLYLTGKLIFDSTSTVKIFDSLHVTSQGKLTLKDGAKLYLGNKAIIEGDFTAQGLAPPEIISTSQNDYFVIKQIKNDLNIQHLVIEGVDTFLIDSLTNIIAFDNIYFGKIKSDGVYLKLIRKTSSTFKDTFNGLTFSDSSCKYNIWLKNGDTLWVINHGGEATGENYEFEEGGVIEWSEKFGSVRWIYPEQKDKYIGEIRSSAIIYNGRCYIGDELGKFYALDINTGDTIWTLKLSGAIRGIPSYFGGKIYLGTYGVNAKVYAIEDEGSSPSILWSYDVPGAIVGAVISDGDRVYFGASDGNIYALNATNGQEAWNTPYSTNGSICSSPCVNKSANSIAIGSDIDTLFKINAENGDWTGAKALGGDVKAAPWYDFYSDKIYVGSYGTDFYCIDFTNFDTIWTFTNPSSGIHTMCWQDFFVPGRYIYFVDVGGKLWVVDTLGNQNPYGWTTYPFDAGSPIHALPIVWNKVCYFGADNGFFYAINKETGELIWKYNTGSVILSLPSISVSDSCIVIGTKKGKVYCFWLAHTH